MTAVVLAPLLVGALLFVVFVRFVYPRRTLPRAPARVVGEVLYRVPAHASAAGVATDLARVGIVDSPWLFATYLRFVGANHAFRVGETVSLPFGTTPTQLARRLARGLGAIVVRVTIPEGFDGVDVAERLAARGLSDRESLLAAILDPAVARSLGVPGESLEGYLFPDTYELRDDESPIELLGHLVDNQRARVRPLFESHRSAVATLASDAGLDEHGIIVLASIVEKEAAVADERPRIAGVFLNRLKSPTFLPRQRLQSDPTVSYGCRVEPERIPSCAGFDGTITRAMLEDASNPFNTYRHAGLPPTPIANPGLAAIEAVLSAEHHDYFYFVARGGRRHSFSTTLDAHNAAVDDARTRGALP